MKLPLWQMYVLRSAPGGHVDLGEIAMESAARELSEESSVIGHPVRYLTNVDVVLPHEDRRPVILLCFNGFARGAARGELTLHAHLGIVNR